MAIGNVHKKLVKIALVIVDISSWTDSETHRHIQMYSSQYFATAPVGEVIRISGLRD